MSMASCETPSVTDLPRRTFDHDSLGGYGMQRSRTTSSESQESGIDLMSNLASAVDVLQRASHDGRTAHFQPSTACVISAVRSILSKTDCLAKESTVLRRHSALADQRKNILALLASMVSQARRCSAAHVETASGLSAYSDEQWQDINALIVLSDTVLSSVRSFVHSAESAGVDMSSPRQTRPEGFAKSVSMTKAKSVGDLRQNQHTDEFVPPLPVNAREVAVNFRAASGRSPSGCSSASNQSVSSTSPTFEPALSSANTSVDSIPMPQTPADFNSEQFGTGKTDNSDMSTLNSLHDRLLSALAALIGHVHAHSTTLSMHPSSMAVVIDMASEVVGLVGELLRFIDTHNDGKQRPVQQRLQESRGALHASTTNLVEAIRAATSDVAGRVNDNSSSRQLLDAATAVLKEARLSVGTLRQGLSPSFEVTEEGQPQVFVLPDQREEANAPSNFNSQKQNATFSMLVTSETSLADLKERFGESQKQSTSASCQLPPHASEVASSLVERRGLIPPSPLNLSRKTAGIKLHSTGASSAPLAPISASIVNGAHQTRQIFTANVLDKNAKQQNNPDGGLAERSYLPRDICFNNDGQVTGGTLACLVERMTLHDTTIDPVFAAAFFITFRLFTTPLELLDTLSDRFKMSPPDDVASNENKLAHWTLKCAVPVRLRVFNIIKTWLENHWVHGSDHVILDPLRVFTKETISRKMENAANRLLDIIEKRQKSVQFAQRPRILNKAVSSDRLKSNALAPKSAYGGAGGSFRGMFGGGSQAGGDASNAASSPPPQPAISRNLLNSLRTQSLRTIPITDFDPLEVARQLTIMESRLYFSIQPTDLIKQDFGCPNIKNMSTSTTRITGWVTECILGEHDAKKRAYLVKYFIKVAEKCHGLRNYNTLIAILAALGSSTITRLKRTWEGLSTKYRQSLEIMRRATDHTRNYAEYRNALRNAAPPCLPFLGLYLTDITFCYEGNPATRQSPADASLKLINFDRYQKMYRIVADLQRFQSPYNLLEVPEVQIYLSQCLQATDANVGISR